MSGTTISITNNDPRLDEPRHDIIKLLAIGILSALVGGAAGWIRANTNRITRWHAFRYGKPVLLAHRLVPVHVARTYAGSELERRFNWWQYAVSFIDAGIALDDFSQRGMMAALAPEMTQTAWNATVKYLVSLNILDSRPGRGTHIREGIDWQQWRESPIWRRKAGVAYPDGHAPEPIRLENSETSKEVNNDVVLENKETDAEPALTGRVVMTQPPLTTREMRTALTVARLLAQEPRRAD